MSERFTPEQALAYELYYRDHPEQESQFAYLSNDEKEAYLSDAGLMIAGLEAWDYDITDITEVTKDYCPSYEHAGFRDLVIWIVGTATLLFVGGLLAAWIW